MREFQLQSRNGIWHIDEFKAGKCVRVVASLSNAREAEIVVGAVNSTYETGILDGIGATPIIVGATNQRYVIVSAIQISEREYAVVGRNQDRDHQYGTWVLVIQSDGSLLFSEDRRGMITLEAATFDMIERAGYSKERS